MYLCPVFGSKDRMNIFSFEFLIKYPNPSISKGPLVSPVFRFFSNLARGVSPTFSETGIWIGVRDWNGEVCGV